MRLIILLGFILLLAPVNISAQNPDEYRLRDVPPETFISAIPELRPLTTDQDAISLADDITTEMKWRYEDISHLSVTDIEFAFQSLKSSEPYVWMDHSYWQQNIILSHINSNGFQLTGGDTFHLLDLQVTVKARDFNADGQPEFLLHVDSGQYRQMLVLEEMSNNLYRLVPAPLPWFADGQPYYSTLSGGLEEILFDDITNDGLPEWVLTFGGVKANHKQHGRLIILKWQNGTLVDVAAFGDYYSSEEGMSYVGVSVSGPGIHPPYVNWFARNVDDDLTKEIQQVQEFTDNWTCTFIETRTFDWNVEALSYQLQSIDRAYEESTGCNLRSAQQAMWDGDIERAVNLYEASRHQADDLSDLHMQYLDLRLALAYSLIGERSKVDALLQNIQTQIPPSLFMEALTERVTRAYEQLPTALNLCQAMYNKFAEGFTFYKWEAQNLGTITDVPVPSTSIEAPRVNPIRAGCDFPTQLEAYMSGVTLPLSSPLNVEPKHMITADFDNDGTDEHLIWFSKNREFFPYLLTGNGISRPPIPYPDENTVLITKTLENGETILIYKFYRNDVHIDEFTFPNIQFYSYTCYPLVDRGDSLKYEQGYLRTWRLNGSELVTTLDMPLCEDVSVDRVLNRYAISGWTLVEEQAVVEAQYEWNDETDRYEIVSLNDAAIPENFGASNQQVMSISYAIYLSKREYQNTRNWFWGILRMQRALDGNPDNTQERIRLHYWLGFFYETANIESRAVEHYLAAATDGSGTPWGELAALHLTREP